jgi:hypothetical protein
MRLPNAVLLTIFAVSLIWTGAAWADGDIKAGRKIAITHCARCHVIGSYNRFGGIDSTPPFQMLAKRADMAERLTTFYARCPHPCPRASPNGATRRPMPRRSPSHPKRSKTWSPSSEPSKAGNARHGGNGVREWTHALSSSRI